MGVGKKTFVGAMLLSSQGEDSTWPLNAALDMAIIEVKTKSGVETSLRRNKHTFYSVNEENASTMATNFASLST